jgi:hypothetical protein
MKPGPTTVLIWHPTSPRRPVAADQQWLYGLRPLIRRSHESDVLGALQNAARRGGTWIAQPALDAALRSVRYWLASADLRTSNRLACAIQIN